MHQASARRTAVVGATGRRPNPTPASPEAASSPAPFGPTRAVIEPGARVRLTPRSRLGAAVLEPDPVRRTWPSWNGGICLPEDVLYPRPSPPQDAPKCLVPLHDHLAARRRRATKSPIAPSSCSTRRSRPRLSCEPRPPDRQQSGSSRRTRPGSRGAPSPAGQTARSCHRRRHAASTARCRSSSDCWCACIRVSSIARRANPTLPLQRLVGAVVRPGLLAHPPRQVPSGSPQTARRRRAPRTAAGRSPAGPAPRATSFSQLGSIHTPTSASPIVELSASCTTAEWSRPVSAS